MFVVENIYLWNCTNVEVLFLFSSMCFCLCFDCAAYIFNRSDNGHSVLLFNIYMKVSIDWFYSFWREKKNKKILERVYESLNMKRKQYTSVSHSFFYGWNDDIFLHRRRRRRCFYFLSHQSHVCTACITCSYSHFSVLNGWKRNRRKKISY
jgi:hypothetical protein